VIEVQISNTLATPLDPLVWLEADEFKQLNA
jgi:hypothetical protein